MSRSSTFFAASFILVVAACGDDTTASTGTGGGSSSTSTAASTGGSPTSTTSSSSSASSSSSSDGGGTSDGGGGAGEGGAGGSGGAGEGGEGTGGSASFEETCEALNEQFLGYADTLGCELRAVGTCELPDECAEETIAFVGCYDEFLDIDDCACLFDVEDGVEYLQCPPPECDDEDDALYECSIG